MVTLFLFTWQLLWGKKIIMIMLRIGFPGGLVVKKPPAMQEMRVQSLGQEDPLAEEMATH